MIDSAAARSGFVSGRPILSALDLGIVSRWTQECESEHPVCRHRRSETLESSPARVVDIDHEDSDAVRLVDYNLSLGPYTAISYCWGKKPFLITTKNNFQRHKHSIRFSELPKTFRDAVEITRSIGVRYIWIDSLCILQDDPEDWEHESKTMGDIYQGSFLTISASSSVDKDGGCLFADRQEVPKLSVPFNPKFNELKEEFFLAKASRSFKELCVSGPLSTRAWAVQERYLSHRVLHCTEDQLFWECHSNTVSESGQAIFLEARKQYREAWARKLSDKNSPAALTTPLPTLDPEIIMRLWNKLLEGYSEREMSFEDDKLPAISALARRFSRHTKSGYFAGIWESHLLDGLQWYNPGVSKLRHPKNYRAPSWSWAAYDGKIAMKGARDYSLEVVRAAVLKDVHLTPVGKDSFGRLAAAEMGLEARTRAIILNPRSIYSEEDENDKSYDIRPNNPRILSTIRDLRGLNNLVEPPLEKVKVVHDLLEAEPVVGSCHLDTDEVPWCGAAYIAVELRRVRTERDYSEVLILKETQSSDSNQYMRIGTGYIGRHILDGHRLPERIGDWFGGSLAAELRIV